MADNIETKLNGRINCSIKNVEIYTYNELPLLDKNWDYAVIVEVEDDEKTARVDFVTREGGEIASLFSNIFEKSHLEQGRYTPENGKYDPLKLFDELREYLPEKFKEWLNVGYRKSL